MRPLPMERWRSVASVRDEGRWRRQCLSLGMDSGLTAMTWVIGTVIAVIALVVGAVIAGQAGLLRGRPPADLGVRDGRLKRPSLTPNSVSSQADLHSDHPMREYARIPPLWRPGECVGGDRPCACGGPADARRRGDRGARRLPMRSSRPARSALSTTSSSGTTRPHSRCKCARGRASAVRTSASTEPASRPSAPSYCSEFEGGAPVPPPGSAHRVAARDPRLHFVRRTS